MLGSDLLLKEELPEGFSYPAEFLRVVDLGLQNLEPWRIFGGDLLSRRLAGLRGRYPARSLVPFARQMENDEIACWGLDQGSVSIIHDFAAPGWEQVEGLGDFSA